MVLQVDYVVLGEGGVQGLMQVRGLNGTVINRVVLLAEQLL